MQAPFPDNRVRRKKLRSNRSNYADLVLLAEAASTELERNHSWIELTTIDCAARLSSDGAGERHDPVRIVSQLFAKMLINGQFTMKPLPWKLLLSVPAGVMLIACVPTSASALAKLVWRTRLARGTESFH